MKHLEGVISAYKDECSMLKREIESEKESNIRLADKCRYMEINLEGHFKCTKCDFKAIRKVDLLNHVNLEHKGEHDDKPALKIQELSALDSNIKTKTKDLIHKCEMCKRVFLHGDDY